MLEKLLELSQSREHLFFSSSNLIGMDCFASPDYFIYLEVDEFEDSRPEEVLIPAEVLIDFCSLLSSGSIVLG